MGNGLTAVLLCSFHICVDLVGQPDLRERMGQGKRPGAVHLLLRRGAGPTLCIIFSLPGRKTEVFMKREFLKSIQVNGADLPDEVVDTILQEHARTLEAAAANTGANGGTGGRTFTQEEVNQIVSDRLARERAKQPIEDDREKALKAREARLDCRDYLDSKKYPVALLEVLDSSDVDKFKAAADALAEKFPGAFTGGTALRGAKPASPAFSGFGSNHDKIADAFKPPQT